MPEQQILKLATAGRAAMFRPGPAGPQAEFADSPPAWPQDLPWSTCFLREASSWVRK
jgi:hypothetical protein